MRFSTNGTHLTDLWIIVRYFCKDIQKSNLEIQLWKYEYDNLQRPIFNMVVVVPIMKPLVAECLYKHEFFHKFFICSMMLFD